MKKKRNSKIYHEVNSIKSKVDLSKYIGVKRTAPLPHGPGSFMPALTAVNQLYRLCMGNGRVSKLKISMPCEIDNAHGKAYFLVTTFIPENGEERDPHTFAICRECYVAAMSARMIGGEEK